jgi:hypothetical protein
MGTLCFGCDRLIETTCTEPDENSPCMITGMVAVTFAETLGDTTSWSNNDSCPDESERL